MNVYKVRKAQTKANGKVGVSHYALGVPREIAERLEGQRFEFTLTEDGILYRPVGSPDAVELPTWASKA